jgi:hypothetical protein
MARKEDANEQAGRRSIAKLLLSRMRERRMARVGIELRVELLKAQALARAQLADHRAKLADFEERVRETEDLWGQPFQRGRAIIQRSRATIERRERIYGLLDQAAEAYDAGDEERAMALYREAERIDEVHQ